MVTVRNDIETASIEGIKVKDVNLKQEEARPVARRRKYRCVTIVGVLAVVLLSAAVGSVLFFEYVLSGIPVDNAPSSTAKPERQTEPAVPSFTDPFDRTSTEPEIVVDVSGEDADGEIDIDGTSTTTEAAKTTTTTTTTTEMIWTYEGSGGISDEDDNDDDDDDDDVTDNGSGSGDGDLW